MSDAFVRIGYVRKTPRGLLLAVIQGGGLEALISVIRAARGVNRPVLISVWEPRDGENMGSVSAAVARPREGEGPPIKDDFGPDKKKKKKDDDLDSLFG
ncbi:MAG: hypothetical protein QN130_12365 [Armatimonadota bacterium]|nr:hypothetical protein [Armatimonadota bacterium]